MTLNEIISDIHALNEDLGNYERKYGILSETFYEAYAVGDEPEEESWVLDWADWAGAYKILLRRQEQYRNAIAALMKPLILRTNCNEAARISSSVAGGAKL